MKNYGKKAVSAAIVASMMLASNSMLASAAWSKDSSNIWSWTEDGKKATGWAKINGSWYYFDGNGKMKTGWIQDNTGAWFYMNSNGAMQTGWLKDGSKWYFLKGNGAMQTGWLKQNSKWYYMNKSGAMQSGFYTVKDKTYYSSADGAMQNGVVEINKEIYYFDESGSMATGKVKIGKVTYTFGEDGKLTSSVKPPIDVSFNSSGSATTPTPARPTGGGGGGGYYPSTPETPVAGPATITADNYSDFDWDTKYSTVTIDSSGMLPTDTYDFSKLQAQNVEVVSGESTKFGRSAATQPTFIFSTWAGSINLKVAVDIGGANISSITINCTGIIAIDAAVTIVINENAAAAINATGTIGTVEANKPLTIQGTGVQNVTANADVKLADDATVGTVTVPATATTIPTITAGSSATVTNVVANAPTTLAGAGSFTKAEIQTTGTLAINATGKVSNVVVNANATAAAITGTGTVSMVTADAKTTIAVKNVIDVNTTANVVVAATSTVSNVHVTGNTTGTTSVNVQVNGTVSAITKPADGNVTTDGSDKVVPVTVAADKPVATDYSITHTDAAKPEKGALKATAADKLEYRAASATTWTKLTTTGAELAPGEYFIRTAETKDEKGDVTKGASVAVPVTINAYTGMSEGDNPLYYVNSVKADGWQADGKYYVTGELQKSQWVTKGGAQVYLDKDGVNKGDFGLSVIKGGSSSIIGTTTAMEYATTKDAANWTACTAGTTSIKDAKAGTYYVRLKAVTDQVGLSSISVPVNVTVANMPEAPTGLKGIAPENSTADGAITGTTELMEYAETPTGEWFDCQNEKTVVGAGTYYVRVKATADKPFGKMTSVVVPAYAEMTSSLGIAPMTDADYEALDWTGKPETLTSVEVIASGSALKLQGNVPYTKAFTGFSSIKEEQSGHYVFVKLVVPKAVKAGATAEEKAVIPDITVSYTSVDGDEATGMKTIGASAFDNTTECGFVYRVDDRKATPITFVVDFDGKGKDYAPATYTLDFSGLTLEDSGIPSAPTGLSGVKPTTATGKGAISGTTAAMQYREKVEAETETWEDCTDKTTAVDPGKTYLVRYKPVTEGSKPASSTIEVSVPAYTEIASSMSFTQMTTEEYNALPAETWTGKAVNSSVTATLGTENKVTLTGTLPYTTGFTGFNTTKPEQQFGHYVFLNLEVPKSVKAVTPSGGTEVAAEIPKIKITFTSVDGVADVKTIVAGDFDRAKKCGLIYRVDDRMTTPITFTVDFDGDAGDYSPVTYTLDFSGLTLQDSTTPIQVKTHAELEAALKGVATKIEIAETIAVTSDLVIPKGKTVTFATGKKLTVTEGKKLTNNGTIVANDEDGLKVGLAAGGTVKFGKDIEATSTMVVAEGVSSTMDLNGFKLTKAESFTEHDVFGNYQIANRGTLIINGGTSADNAKGAIVDGKTKNSERNIWNFGDLTINGAKIVGYYNVVNNVEYTDEDERYEFDFALKDATTTIKNCDFEAGHTAVSMFRQTTIAATDSIFSSKYYAAAGNGLVKDKDVSMTFTGCELTSAEDVAIFMPSAGTATFNSCTISGLGGIEVRGGATINVSDTTVEATGTTYKEDSDSGFSASNGSIIDNCGILLLSHSAYGGTGDAMVLNIDATSTVSSASGHGIRVNASSTIGAPTITITYTADRVTVTEGKEKFYLANSRLTGVTVKLNGTQVFPVPTPPTPAANTVTPPATEPVTSPVEDATETTTPPTEDVTTSPTTETAPPSEQE